MITHKMASAPTIPSRPGQPYPLGATVDEQGVNFSIYSEHATSVSLCLFSSKRGEHETHRIELTEKTENVWHIYLEGVRPGQLYGYRVDGPYAPEEGHYFNANKLLLDPYAREIHGTVGGEVDTLGYNHESEAEDRYREMSEVDSGKVAPKSVVIDSAAFDWGDDQAPRTPMHKSMVYEMHVKGFTYQHPTIDGGIRGSYAALGTPEAIEYLQKLGVTAVELLPVHQFTNESYWGYNSIGFFAPHNGYASSDNVVHEFKQMVKNLHAAGIEVILDVVYNHTAEGNEMGPTLSFKGIDNRVYYHTVPEQPQFYMNHTGTGNTFNLTHPQTLRVVMDSLRYWVQEMHVDGFRFDLASALIRELGDNVSSFLDTVNQDPTLSQVKLIAEPWDIGSYHVGQFPVRWSEWNGKYRDCVRKFWKGDEGQAHEMTLRLLGSPDLYADGRGPGNSVNFIIAHDGFTLNDLVSYNEKHNEANGENNNDGESNNESWNMGVEGPTDDADINAARERQKRNFMTTLLLSQGAPMFMMGDEYGRTQHGNNNGYNQDSDISWFNWNWEEKNQQLFDYVSQLAQVRLKYPLLSRRKFYDTEQIDWLRPDGEVFTEQDYANGDTRCLALWIDGARVDEQDESGTLINETKEGSSKLLWILNSYWEPIPFTLPAPHKARTHYEVIVDTYQGTVESGERVDVKTPFMVPERSSILLRMV
ncbi:glycogen debranching enzyme GlgX [Fibrella aestuarina BUZ 2]|uniref:Glycogen debranching enzyme GlgX n=1 Tax=Fibrella aestuarina BUZ 2 TaxID=1166018 RepID=I0KA65_9BACT|nr:glycogen debranching protein GlgX [Fibrella aestuarina]CCH01018.1 glycogen debranching enzyme GlgX [Fibrella aestuarina BUZ 2]